ncbi:hypothetical protein SAMN05443428_10960 [Caloramator quimbayensis]|uniref:Uncharacterized protein n=1 Tax=Caloramator quimbayensis TaxID=1147123 RepID=A0A1T4XIU1_9CLOT|nr:hypothetical protein [Caloramator quimbayensis]SKA89011.1 hypothetical protein SAMN05443428_10960 [Caloramator quimbayensis]
MPLYSQKVVKSKYKSYHTFISKRISYKDKKIKNILDHNERIVKIQWDSKPAYIDVFISIQINFFCSIEERNEILTYPVMIDENIQLRVHKSSFKPLPLESDFKNAEFAAYIRNLEGIYDIDISGDTLTIDIIGFLIINMMAERCIILKENKNINLNEFGLKQVAISGEDAPKDVKGYLNNLEGISKIVSRRIDELEEENSYLKDEVKRLQTELDKRNIEYNDIKRKDESVMGEYKRLIEKLKDMEDKYLKEQKRANVLEVENSRNIDELKKLRKENSDLLAKLDKEKITIKDKFKRFMNSV